MDIHSKDYQEAWEERAAIMEYCGGLPRTEAEYRARRCLDHIQKNQVVPETRTDQVEQRDCTDQVESGEDHNREDDGRSEAARAALTQARAILKGE
ncbi:MAG: hypothetical protein SV201_04805 [Pseudomonadota bacterium]|nr:hypothetical protein [Pseudomonadota bacterium]